MDNATVLDPRQACGYFFGKISFVVREASLCNPVGAPVSAQDDNFDRCKSKILQRSWKPRHESRSKTCPIIEFVRTHEVASEIHAQPSKYEENVWVKQNKSD